MTTILAIANQKGGVAKTTTTLSLGGALVQMGNEVLMVDLDPQADLSLGLGIEPNRVLRSIADVFFNTASLLSVSRETSIAGLDLVPANQEMQTAEHLLPMRPKYESILRTALQVQMPYDYVLLDCPPAIGAITINALTAAHLLIIPTQAEYYAVHALKNMLTAVRKVRNQGNVNLAYRILITMLDRRNRIHRTLSEQLRANFSGAVFQTTLEVDTRLRESSVAGLPISYHSQSTRGALQYHSLAQEIVQYAQQTTDPAHQTVAAGSQPVNQQPA